MSTKKLFSISALTLLAVMSFQRATAKQPEQPISVQRKLAAAAPAAVSSEKNDMEQERYDVWDCSDLPCDLPSGVYNILEGGNCVPVPAYCDFSDGTGWTVIQRREDVPGQQLDFNRNYDLYRHGFGDLHDPEFWWGLEHVWCVTSRHDRVYELRVDLTDFSGASRYALYGQFHITSHGDRFRLTIAGYSGDAGDGLAYHNGMQFSTIDEDHDQWLAGSCTGYYTAGWWYNECYISNLNGVYLGDNNPATTQRGVTWQPWHGYYYSLKGAQMKIRPVS